MQFNQSHGIDAFAFSIKAITAISRRISLIALLSGRKIFFFSFNDMISSLFPHASVNYSFFKLLNLYIFILKIP